MRTFFSKLTAIALSLSITIASTIIVSAEQTDTAVIGKVYEFGGDSRYEISAAESFSPSDNANTYGKFTISGDIKSTSQKNDLPAYEIGEGKISFTYKYDNKLIHNDLDSWHLIEDKTNQIDGRDIGSDINRGIIWLQTSIDNTNWNNAVCLTDVFGSTPENEEPFYESKDVEIINGYYYRLIIAYETRIRTENSDFLFIDTDKFEYKKHAEVYHFYAYTGSIEKEKIDYDKTYNIGSKVRVQDYDAYYGEQDIVEGDPHYGWELGNFFVSGYTDKRIYNNGEDVVFLKNPGDKVTLWFKLLQNIDSLNGKNNLTITADTDGFDQYFETPRTNFGKGALIIRYTDYNNNKSEPQIYTNYLEANTSFGADTKVQLFEEGDYEVALDYEVSNSDWFSTGGHYRIFFKFSVRNGNCMAYPFDVKTGSELTNTSMTENGFRLDLAKSRYLKVLIRREVLKEGADGLTEDTRFNGPAKDGAEYTEDGIYTITVSNDYTNELTVKKIYVGTNNILRAHMVTGLPISQINHLVAEGATIRDDGTIQLADKFVESVVSSDDEFSDSNVSSSSDSQAEDESTAESATSNVTNEENGNTFPVIPLVISIAIAAIAIIVVSVVISSKKKPVKHDEKTVHTDENEEGEDNQ